MTLPASRDHLRAEDSGWWPVLLVLGTLGAMGTAALLLWYALGTQQGSDVELASGAVVTQTIHHGPTFALVAGLGLGLLAQATFTAGIIGWGIWSSGVRQAIDRLTAFIAGTT